MNSLFHLSLPCKGIESTKNFYVNILGANLGRNTNQWLDIDLYNHQITFTKSGDFNFVFKNYNLKAPFYLLFILELFYLKKLGRIFIKN